MITVSQAVSRKADTVGLRRCHIGDPQTNRHGARARNPACAQVPASNRRCGYDNHRSCPCLWPAPESGSGRATCRGRNGPGNSGQEGEGKGFNPNLANSRQVGSLRRACQLAGKEGVSGPEIATGDYPSSAEASGPDSTIATARAVGVRQRSEDKVDRETPLVSGNTSTCRPVDLSQSPAKEITLCSRKKFMFNLIR